MLERLAANPLIRPQDVAPSREDLEVYCVLNPGAVRVGDETLLLLRVGERPRPLEGTLGTVVYDHAAGELSVRHYRLDDPRLRRADSRGFFYDDRLLLTSLSHLRLARGRDGERWQVAPAPAIAPATEWEAYGCEDARITPIDGRYAIAYTAVSHLGVNAMLAVTEDFERFERLGIVATTFNKNVCVFPERVGGHYVCRHRPYRSEFNEPCLWTAYSPDLVHWGRHHVTHRPAPHTWEGVRVGAGAPPIRTPAGWLEIYHAADETGRYCLGAMLSDLEHPERMLCRSSRPVLEPVEPYETRGVYGNVVYTSGLTVDGDGTMTIYYGAADTVTAAARTTVDAMIAAAQE